jgi:6-phosphogluconolactonase
MNTPSRDLLSLAKVYAYDERRDIALPGDAPATIAYAAAHFIETARKAISERGVFTVALSGGSTPKAIYELLAASESSAQIDWSKVKLFWSDERCVPPDSPESNYLMAMKAGFSLLPLPPANIFRMPAEHEVEKGAKKYEKLILEHVPSARFDLMMLGMGEDGHTASLFPKTHGLHSMGQLVTANYVPQKQEWRMTLTFNCINAASHIAVYVIGKGKGAMMKQVFTAPYDPTELPVQQVGSSDHKALWIADSAAAGPLLAYAKDHGRERG